MLFLSCSALVQLASAVSMREMRVGVGRMFDLPGDLYVRAARGRLNANGVRYGRTCPCFLPSSGRLPASGDEEDPRCRHGECPLHRLSEAAPLPRLTRSTLVGVIRWAFRHLRLLLGVAHHPLFRLLLLICRHQRQTAMMRGHMVCRRSHRRGHALSVV